MLISCFQAQDAGVGLDSVGTIGFVDMNAPIARQKAASLSLMNGISVINGGGDSSKNCTILMLPDLPKDSSLRGLYDEERAILEACFGLRQHVETRFIDLFTRDRRAEVRSNSRRFSEGRIVVAGDTHDQNFWLASELAVCGRATSPNEGESGAPTSVLPKSSQLLLPEGSSPNSDLKISERMRPSPDQVCAQKGTQRLQSLLESVLRHSTSTSNAPKHILVVNLTGYVEELAAAVPCLYIFFLQ